MFPYSRQFIDDEDIAGVVETLRSDFITQGPKVKEFEEALAAYCGARFAVAFNSGTSALHAAYFVAGLKPGDEFLVPAITFCATANAGVFLGAKPVFVDVEEETGNLDLSSLDSLITPRTKLVVPVHYAGHPVDLEGLSRLAQKHDLKVVEDACHALGAEYQGEKIGSCRWSDLTVFSFHPVKPITTGEGGAVLTNNEDLYRKLLMFREHGIVRQPEEFRDEPHGPWYYEMQLLGWNYRLTDFQAALGLSQLKKLPWFLKRRREIAEKYREIFAEEEFFALPQERPGMRSSWHLFPVRLKEPYLSHKSTLFRRLRTKGLGVQVHYLPVYRHPFYREQGIQAHCPRAETFYQRELSLPLHQGLTEDDVNQIVEKIREVFSEL